MTIILDWSSFETLNIRTFREMFKINDIVVINGHDYVITNRYAFSTFFKISLRYDEDITFEIHFKFKSDKAGSLDSVNIMFRDNTKISDEKRIIRRLGSGSFGNVFLVCVAGKEYAMKVGLDISPSSGKISAIRREMIIFEHLREHPPHENLIKSFPIDFQLRSAILMELGQETLDIKIKFAFLRFEQKMKIILQILSAVAFLHSIGISHNDLKPDNIIFVDEVPKLFDFNLSYRWEKYDSFRSYLCGTPGYKHPSPTTNYAQDVFSCCFILIEMLIEKNIRSFNSKTPSGIKELSEVEIEIKLREKQVSNENIKIIVSEIYQNRHTIKLNRLIELVKTIQ